MQHGPLQLRNLIDDRREQLPAHVGRRLELRISARARGAEQIAAVGGFQIETNRVVLGDFAIGFDVFEITPRIDDAIGFRPFWFFATLGTTNSGIIVSSFDDLCRRPLLNTRFFGL